MKNPKQPPNFYRPLLCTVENMEPYIKHCMIQCWDEQPGCRPKFSQIKKMLKPLSRGM